MLGTTRSAKLRAVLAACGPLAAAACGGAGGDEGVSVMVSVPAWYPDTMWAVVLPSLLSPFGAYLVRVYVPESVPVELIDAARVDRAGELRIFWQIAVPVMRPAIVTVFLFTLVPTWDNYFLPLVMPGDADLYPLTAGLPTWFDTARQEAGTRVLFNLVVTGSLPAIVPLVVAFVLLQRFWRGGAAAGALK
ncbi:carbohydrate ABC transporter permease [Actinosynnema sp. NPDC053489]|uniref:carbohydrate ABC transporter permease n=1 Tax=Actinosynnema sp. NPDC053489 TaxID=3363916 RepID=UPI0037CBBA92